MGYKKLTTIGIGSSVSHWKTVFLMLDGRHTVFGKVAKGQDVVKAMEAEGTSSGKPKK